MIRPTVCVGVLDDEPQMRIALTRLLRSHGLSVVSFENGEDVLAAVARGTPRLECLLLDLHMPGLTGFDVLARLANSDRTIPVVVFTGHDERGNAARVRALGARSYLLKPLDETALLAAIHSATGLVAGPLPDSSPQ